MHAVEQLVAGQAFGKLRVDAQIGKPARLLVAVLVVAAALAWLTTWAVADPDGPVYAAQGTTKIEVAEGALVSSLADETPEGRSIVELAVSAFGLSPLDDPNATLVPFTAQTRMSGVDFEGRRIRKGAADSVRRSAPFHQSFDARLGRRV